jgi:hypothetical protein
MRNASQDAYGETGPRGESRDGRIRAAFIPPANPLYLVLWAPEDLCCLYDGELTGSHLHVENDRISVLADRSGAASNPGAAREIAGGSRLGQKISFLLTSQSS